MGELRAESVIIQSVHRAQRRSAGRKTVWKPVWKTVYKTVWKTVRKTVWKTVSKTVWKTVWKTGRSSGSAPVEDMQDISAWQDMNRIEPLGSTIRDLQTSMTLPLGTRKAAREKFSGELQETASPLVLLFLLLH